MSADINLSRISIIAEDAALAEEVCARFRSSGLYVVLLDAPMVRLEDYGVFTNDCLEVCNAIKAHRPATVLLIGCQTKVEQEICRFLPPVPVIRLNNFDAEELARIPGFRARRTDPDITERDGKAMGNIVAVEAGDPMAVVIARNLAVAHGASIYVMPAVSKGMADRSAANLRQWANENGESKESAKQELLAFIKSQVGPLTSPRVDSVSFITRGVAYGIFPFAFPTTHLFSFPRLGINVLSGMLKTLNPSLRCPLAVLIDPDKVGTSEHASIKASFGRSGYLLRTAFGENATAMHARYLTEFMPSDFLFYSTHCGERKGRCITERFNTLDGGSHEVTYELVKSLSLSPTAGNIEVQDMYRVVSLDGVTWSDQEQKEEIGAGKIIAEFWALVKRRKGNPEEIDIVRSVDSDFVKSSDSLQMHDSEYLPIPQTVGGNQFPLVFNNACSSWRELAMKFGCNGASVYIGTSLDVLNSVAVNVATHFAKSAAAGKSIGHSLFRAQRGFVRDNGYAPYLMHGYLFTRIRPLPSSAPHARILIEGRVRALLARLQESLNDENQNSRIVMSAQEFLRGELESLTSPICRNGDVS